LAISKKTGKKSVAQNDFLIPLPPGAPIATDIGTNRPFDNAGAVVNFDTPTTNPPTASYTVFTQSEDDEVVKTGSASSSPIIMTGLNSDILYQFYVIGYTAEGVPSDPSPLSDPTLVTSVPQAPFPPTVTSNPKPGLDVPEGTANTSVDSVSWSAPLNGGKTITGYIWECSDGKSNVEGDTPGGGQTTNTFVNVDQESGTSQTYRVQAFNANGESEFSGNSALITSTFAFTPFRAFGFSPFGAFSFVPFNAFGFAPFNAFAFSPFRAFGFSPFGAFSFVPFRAFGFSPFRAFSFVPFRAFGFAPFRAFRFTPSRCIYKDTTLMVMRTEGDDMDLSKIEQVAVKDLQPGDKLLSPVWKELLDHGLFQKWESKVFYNAIEDLELTTSPVISITKDTEDVLMFNGDESKKYSVAQPMLVRKDGETPSFSFTDTLEVGDLFWEYSLDEECYTEVVIESIERIPAQEVYFVEVGNTNTYIAGNIVCHK
jgi:hypothetical protein